MTGGGRRLQSTSDDIRCRTDEEMRNYMRDKRIVVFSAKSFLSEENSQPNENELVTYLTPIVEKQLDFPLQKSVKA